MLYKSRGHAAIKSNEGKQILQVAVKNATLDQNVSVATVLLNELSKGVPVGDVLELANRMKANLKEDPTKKGPEGFACVCLSLFFLQQILSQDINGKTEENLDEREGLETR